MSPAAGSVYGASRYGSFYYGGPSQTPQPFYSVAPVVSTALDYGTIQLSWDLPSCVRTATIRLVRNSFSVPSNEIDGLTLMEGEVSSTAYYLDNAFSTGQQGHFQYYSLWILDTTFSTVWQRAGDNQAMLPKNWGSGATLFSRIPAYFRNLDLEAGLPAPVGAIYNWDQPVWSGGGTVPSSPTGVTATAEVDQVLLGWVAPANTGAPMLGYIITPYISGVAQTAITTGVVTSYPVNGLVPGTSYTFTVAAINTVGTSVPSAPTAAVTPLAPVAPSFTASSPPAGLLGVAYTYTFAASGLPAPTFSVTTGLLPEGLALNATTGVLSGTPSYTATSQFSVTATNSTGSAVAAVSIAITVPITVPDSPTSVMALAGNAQVSLAWTAPDYSGGATITSYRIVPYISGTAQAALNTGSTTTSATVTGLTNGTTYTFTVAATNSAGTGAASAQSAAITPEAISNTVLPVVSGIAQQTRTLTTTNGSWSTTPTSYTYQWNGNGTAIASATAQTYVLQATDVGTTITCSVTAAITGATATAVSEATATVVSSSTPLLVQQMHYVGNETNATYTYNWPQPTTVGSILVGFFGLGNNTGLASPWVQGATDSYYDSIWKKVATVSETSVVTTSTGGSNAYSFAEISAPALTGAFTAVLAADNFNGSGGNAGGTNTITSSAVSSAAGQILLVFGADWTTPVALGGTWQNLMGTSDQFQLWWRPTTTADTTTAPSVSAGQNAGYYYFYMTLIGIT